MLAETHFHDSHVVIYIKLYLEITTGDEFKKISSPLLEKVTVVGEINANIYLMHT